jgi:hypothetical protein
MINPNTANIKELATTCKTLGIYIKVDKHKNVTFTNGTYDII